jgi:hypothetical protein
MEHIGAAGCFQRRTTPWGSPASIHGEGSLAENATVNWEKTCKSLKQHENEQN